MEEELEETSLRHRSGATRHHHHHHQRRRAKKPPPPTTNYDDVFGGPPRHAVPFSGVPDDYAEVFGGVSVSCSIPFLDLPTAQMDGWDCASGESVNGVDYREIFGRCDFADFAVPYDQLFGSENGDGEIDMHFSSDSGKSSIKGKSGPQMIDPSAFIQEYSSEDNIPYLDDMNFSVSSNEIPEYNTSYNKSSRTPAKELLHTPASVAQPQTGFTFVVEPNKPLPEHLPVITEDTVTHENSVKSNTRTAANSDQPTFKREPVPLEVPFLDASDISLQPRSANLPPPARPPAPKFILNERPKMKASTKADSVSNFSSEIEQSPQLQQEKAKPFLKSDSLPPNFDFVPNLKLDKREKPKLKSKPNTFSKSESLPPGFGSELDAMKEAMEFAQARLKTAKELHEQKREGKITELPLKKKLVKEENLEGSEREKPRVLRSVSLASNFGRSREFMKVQGEVVATQNLHEWEKTGKWRSDEDFHELTSIEPTKDRDNKVGITGIEPLVEANKESIEINGLPPTGVRLSENLDADVNNTENLELAEEIKHGENLKREEKTTIGSFKILTANHEPVIEIEKETGKEGTESAKEDSNVVQNVEERENTDDVKAETEEGKESKMEVVTEREEQDTNTLDDEMKRQRSKEELDREWHIEKELKEAEEEKEKARKLEEEQKISLQLEEEKERARILEEEKERACILEEEKERKLQMEKEREEKERRMAEEEERLEKEREQKQRKLAEEEERLEKEREQKQRKLAEERERERKLEEERHEEKMREKEMVRKLEEEKERERKLEEEIEKERERVRKLEEEREQERERVRKLEEEKQREREMALKLEKEKERERKLEEEIKKDRERIRKLEEEREQEREKVRKLEEERELERERVRKLEEERELERERVRKLEEEREKERIEKQRERKEREKMKQEMEQKERERIMKEIEQKEMEKKLAEEKEKQRMEKEKEEREKQRMMEKEREEKEMAMRLEADMRRLERQWAEETERMAKLQGEKVKDRKPDPRKSDEEKERERRMKEKDRKTEGRKSDEEREKARERKSDEERERERERRARKEREIEEREREEEERKREREKDRLAMERATQERAERIAIERITAARQRAVENREKEEMNTRGGGEVHEKRRPKAEDEKKERDGERNAREARLRAERAAVERATAEARERAIEKAKAEAEKERDRLERYKSFNKFPSQDHTQESHFKRTHSDSALSQGHGESALRHKARLERQQRTAERAAKALAEKNRRDIMAQREQAERDRLAEHLDAEVKRWSSGKEGNLRALLSTLQYILGQNCGWQPIHLTEVITAADVKKAYRKATLYVHPDKLQQRGASIQQKYICEKVFDLLKEAWNKFNSEER